MRGAVKTARQAEYSNNMAVGPGKAEEMKICFRPGCARSRASRDWRTPPPDPLPRITRVFRLVVMFACLLSGLRRLAGNGGVLPGFLSLDLVVSSPDAV